MKRDASNPHEKNVVIRVTFTMSRYDIDEAKMVAKRNGWPSWGAWMATYAHEGIQDELSRDEARRQGDYSEEF